MEKIESINCPAVFRGPHALEILIFLSFPFFLPFPFFSFLSILPTMSAVPAISLDGSALETSYSEPKGCHIYNYADKHSISGDADNDARIGRDCGLVGSGNSVAIGTDCFLRTKKDGKYNLWFLGALISRQTHQPWEEVGGKKWSYVYKCEHHIPLGDLDKFCAANGFNRKTFTQASQGGSPRRAHLPELYRAISIIRAALEHKPALRGDI